MSTVEGGSGDGKQIHDVNRFLLRTLLCTSCLSLVHLLYLRQKLTLPVGYFLQHLLKTMFLYMRGVDAVVVFARTTEERRASREASCRIVGRTRRQAGQGGQRTGAISPSIVLTRRFDNSGRPSGKLFLPESIVNTISKERRPRLSSGIFLFQECARRNYYQLVEPVCIGSEPL